MKRILATLLAAAAVASSATVVNAQGGQHSWEGTGDGVNININASYIANPVYNVDITWGSMRFTYKEGDKGVWDPATHTYENGEEGSWLVAEPDGDKIAVENHSNTAVDVQFGLNMREGIEAQIYDESGNPLQASDNTVTLPTAVGVDPSASEKSKFKLVIQSGSVDTECEIGVITVSLK